MNPSVVIREAVAEDAEVLSRLAIRSKAYWGYSSEFMNACIDELTVTRSYIEHFDFHYQVAVSEETIVGFYALENFSGDEIELGALFVDPDYIGKGVGQALIENAKKHAIDLGARQLNIQGDPNAERFYRAAGAILTGSKASASIPDRYLPTFKISLTGGKIG
ncbi:MAG: GNAT family N-acetyltransferase [Pseudomonadota bacterium]